jgi:hypothetical protein
MHAGYCWVDIVVTGKVSSTTILPLSNYTHFWMGGRQAGNRETENPSAQQPDLYYYTGR